MKRTLALCVLALTLASFPVSIVCGAPMTIIFQNGATVTYDTDEIKSITFSGAPMAPAASPSGLPFSIAQPSMTEDFDNGLGNRWDPVAVVGGDFGRFARFESGRLVVNVPQGNSWGKTGIQSRQPVFTVDRSFETQPGLILIKTDPSLTTGFVITLASSWHSDVWVLQTVWVHIACTTDEGEGSVVFINTHGPEKYGSEGYLPITPAKAPEWVGLKVYPGKVALQLSGMDSPAVIDMGWIGEGTPVYLQVFSHPRTEGGPAAVAIDQIQVGR
jgi:hypothetical protein